MTPAPANTTTPRRRLSAAALDRAIGAIVGSAVADAAGARFEFLPAGLYSTEFPAPVLGGIGELVGGGSFGWAPGEFTDDTQMALALAAALEEAGGFCAETAWRHFRAWCAGARDVGATTSTALRHESHVGAAEAAHEMLGGRTGSNGSVMRIAPVGVHGVLLGRDELYRVAVAQSNLTHHDPIAAAAAAFVAEVIRLLVEGAGFEDAISEASDMMLESSLGEVFEFRLAPALSRTWDPSSDNGPTNGSARTAVAQAVWAVRHGGLPRRRHLGDRSRWRHRHGRCDRGCDGGCTLWRASDPRAVDDVCQRHGGGPRGRAPIRRAGAHRSRAPPRR